MASSSNFSFNFSAGSRFLVFDQTGDKGRIMFDPNVFYEFRANNVHGDNISNNNIINNNNSSSGNNNSSTIIDSSSCNTNNNNINQQQQLLLEQEQQENAYGEAMASALTALQSMRASRPYSITLCEEQGEKDADSSSEVSCVGSGPRCGQRGGQGGQRGQHVEEDADDLEALLNYSEEAETEAEMSFGQSLPSDVTEQQQQQQQQQAEDDFGEITSGVNGCAPVKAGRVNGAKSALLKRKAARRERIRRTVRLLRSIVADEDEDGEEDCSSSSSSGNKNSNVVGTTVDAALILDRAIGYMKLLQAQVLQLEASRSSISRAAAATSSLLPRCAEGSS